MGPGFFVDYLDAEVTLRKPFGSGEQNAYNFAYTLYNLLYLKATNQLKAEVLDKALHHLNIGSVHFMLLFTHSIFTIKCLCRSCEDEHDDRKIGLLVVG